VIRSTSFSTQRSVSYVVRRSNRCSSTKSLVRCAGSSLDPATATSAFASLAAQGAFPRTSGVAGVTLLDAVCGIREFAGAVAACAQHLLDAHGLDGYRALAGLDFPSATLKRLQAELHA
jgi:hypothetical protein